MTFSFPAPFKGQAFDQDFAAAVDTVTQSIAARVPLQIGLQQFHQNVNDTMGQYLYGAAKSEINAYSSLSSQAERDTIVQYVVSGTGVSATDVEAILGEMEIQAVQGAITSIFLKPASYVGISGTVKTVAEATAPSFSQRVMGNFVKMLGVNPADAAKVIRYGAYAIGAILAISLINSIRR